MSILNRLNLLVRSNLNDRIGSERPGAASGALHEMEASLKDARRQLAELKGDERRLGEQIRAARQKADMWEERALLALRGGADDLAREALIAKSDALDEAARLRDQLDELRAYMRDISSALEALEIKLRGTQERIQVQRPEGGYYGGGQGSGGRGERDWDAELQRRMRERGEQAPQTPGYAPPAEAGPLGNPDTWQSFDRMSDRIALMEAKIDAVRTLAGDDPLIDPRRAELEAKFKAMETNKRVGDDLDDLKKKFS